MTYDPNADMEGSLNVAYAAIRQRIANGGPPWVPKCNHSHEPNAETIEAMEAADRGEGVCFNTVEELLADLNKDET